MNKNNSLLLRLGIILAAYLAIKYLVPNGATILYPINLLVTYLHEFGHAFGALMTGGAVDSLKVNSDGSGLCVTLGGNRAVILMGGYIGSAVFGNLLFYIGAKRPTLAKGTMILLGASMVYSAFIWYGQPFTTFLLLVFAVILIALAWLTDFGEHILMFLGLASIIHIIEDFNVGPTSDLERYAEIFVVVPPSIWMYVWLIVVLVLFVVNIRIILRGSFS